MQGTFPAKASGVRSRCLAVQTASYFFAALRRSGTFLQPSLSVNSRDVKHQITSFFASLADRLDDPADRQAVIHCAKVFYKLYGDLFRGLARDTGATLQEAA